MLKRNPSPEHLSYHTISNEVISVVISSLGAEIKSLKDIQTNDEYMWQGDPAIWKGSAPILFPIVGRLKNEQYHYQNQTYSLSKHGFARTSNFTLVKNQIPEKSFLLSSSAETALCYPFQFEFEVGFKLENRSLQVSYSVRNTGDATMLFTLGSHPAFALPTHNGALAGYFIDFECEETLDCYYLQNNLLCEQAIPLYLNQQRQIEITQQLFEQDALIFKNIKSRKISLNHKKTGRRLSIDMQQAPHFALWSKPNAAFICLEPWFSYDDSSSSNGELLNKAGMISLDSNKTFVTGYNIQI
jgi:galactose mutarotase-like enzyme